MVAVRAFRGVRYNPEKVPALGAVVAPPFDVISPDEQEELHRRHPLNYVRVILPTGAPGNNERESRYTRAAATLRGWLADGTLLTDPEPSLYVYEQTFRVPELGGREFTRRSLIGAVLQEPFGEGQVYPHETTHAAPKEDRLKLFTAAGANPSQTFTLFPDPDGAMRAALERAAASPPAVKFTDPAGIRNRFWVVSDGNTVAEITGLMADRPLVIADGHHRYETTLMYREVLGGRGDGSSPVDFMPLCMAAMEDPGLVVLPIHRTLHGLQDFSFARFLEAEAKDFEISEARRDELIAVDLAPKAGMEDLPIFGLAARDEAGKDLFRILRLRSLASVKARAPEFPAVFRALDLTVLHLLLEDLLGIDQEKLERKENIAYFKEAPETLAALDGGAQLAVICRTTPVREIFDVVRTRQRMPQKSTYFYPKVLTGLVLRMVE